ncbi:MAG: GAK system ATP-grasp enzyme [Proteobacteria bacterium]|nr:GAK system ATP-grasp enzyme [Pseudomonadota bacterium]MBU1736831.1 GAK system ATP-grasp enzyme [Pseudomonadota bacterium]
MKIGVIGTKGGWSSETLADTAGAVTGERLLIEMDKTVLDLDAGKVWFNDQDLTAFDALIIKKIGAKYSPDLLDRLEILRFLSGKGVKIFSSPTRIMRVLDRLSCTVTLRLSGIPMPPTTITENVDMAQRTLEMYKEAVFKPLYSTKARGMMVLKADKKSRELITRYKEENRIIYIQKKIDLGDRDLGVVFLGGRYLTTYARCNQGNSWNTTTVSGGKYERHEPAPETIALAKKAQDLFGLDFTCVDVVETAKGPIVFEVSAFGGFRGIVNTSDLDPAGLFVEYVTNKLSEENRP